MIKVFVTHNAEDLDAYYQRALPELKTIADVVLNEAGDNLDTDQLIEAAADCDIIVSHRSTSGEASLFEHSPNLLAFLRCAVDISDVDIDAASRAGVLVGRADKSFVPSTAELAVALMLDLARHVSDSTAAYRHGEQPPQEPGAQLAGSTAGIIGYGAVGSYLASLLAAMGMTVLVRDPHVTVADSVVGKGHVCQVDLSELLGTADWVLPLAPANADTTNLIGARELEAMKRGARLVNVSRGELLDEEAVAAALDSGHLGGLAMDVGRAADQRPSLTLASRPGVVATPHLGGLTPQNAFAQAASSVEQVQAMIDGELPPRSVNAESATRLREYWTLPSARRTST